jgi:Flp pilus assembly secretin CpaC
VTVNKAVVIRLPKKATKVAVTQPKIAEVEVVSPDTVLIHGRAVGATSLVIWFEGR